MCTEAGGEGMRAGGGASEGSEDGSVLLSMGVLEETTTSGTVFCDFGVVVGGLDLPMLPESVFWLEVFSDRKWGGEAVEV